LAEKKLQSLELIRPENSGVRDFSVSDYEEKLKNQNSETVFSSSYSDVFFRILGHILRQDNRQISKMIDNHPELVASVEIKSLCLLNSLILEEPINKFFIRKNPEPEIASKLNHRLASTFMDLFSLISNNTDTLENFNRECIIKLGDFLPEIKIYLALKIIYSEISVGKLEALELINSYSAQVLFDEQMKIFSLIKYYKKIGNTELEEKYLQDYRRIFSPNPAKPVKIKLLANEFFYSPPKTLSNWNKILEEIDRIQEEVILEAGLEKNTCSYFKCSDCCKFTFPVMSLTEFLYLKNWMESTSYDIKRIQAASSKIQDDHQELFGTRLTIIDKSLPENQKRGAENPNNFKYQCPFLDEAGSCSCYPARPLLCRGFGLASDNGVSIKTCNFYIRQYENNSSPDNQWPVFDMRNAKNLAKASDIFLNTEGQQMSGTIVAWFDSQTSSPVQLPNAIS
jgi:Fe-S-cluster containining protein